MFLNESDIFMEKYNSSAFRDKFPGFDGMPFLVFLKKIKVNFEGKNEEDALKYVHQYIASKCSDAADSDVLNRIHFYNTSLINAKTTSKILSKVLSEIAKGTR